MKSPQRNLQPTDALFSLLVLYEDRALVDPLHNAFSSGFVTPRDEQLNTALQAKETRSRAGQERQPPLKESAANLDVVHHLIVQMDEVIDSIVPHYRRNGRGIGEQ